MTRKNNDSIGHFGRSSFSRKQDGKDPNLENENLSSSTKYEFSLADFTSNLLSSSVDENDNLKSDLAAAYKILSLLSLDDHTYTHLSLRPKDADYFYIYPFGLRFEEVTKDNLLKVSLEGRILEGEEYQYNKTGYIIHGSIYQVRPDIASIFHIHTPSIVAVSALRDGLLPISQWALHFYKNVSYHSYNSLALDYEGHGKNIANDLGDNYVMLMQNHGAIICGRTIHEAMFYTYHLEQACKTQIMALSTGKSLIWPNEEICRQAVVDLLSFEEDLGKRDWEAWLRLLTRKYPNE